MVSFDKKIIRQKIHRLLKEQSPQSRRQRSQAVYQRLCQLQEFQTAGWVFCYVSLDYEVDTTTFIDSALESGKKVVVPVILKEVEKRETSRGFLISEIKDRLKELEIGPFGILQPKPQWIRPLKPSVLEMAIVPGIAFGRNGHRLGHGKGFFDRFLHQLSSSCLKVGIGFEFQIVPEIPSESHDILLNAIVTDREVIQISQ